MLVKHPSVSGLTHPVAIVDKDLRKTTSFRIEISELCTVCGARFGIGYFGKSSGDLRLAEGRDDLPQKLIDILARDHWHHREHKGLIELDLS
jgi:hypothetical protein